MRYMNDPRQQKLFDPFERMFSPLAYKTIQRGWQGLFRHAILELLPAEILGEEFHPEVGRPTKELYSMAGLLFIAEFHNWNTEQAAEAYMFNTDIWYALNLNPGPQSMSTRTIERYQKLFRENVLAGDKGNLLRNVVCPIESWSWVTETTPYGILAWKQDPLDGYQKLYFLQ